MSESKTIGRAAAVVSAGILLSRVLGYARNVVIGALLGVGADSDLYVSAFSIPDFLFFLMAGGYLSITLVPLLTDRLATDGAAAARQAFVAVFRVVVGMMVLATVVLMIAAEPVTGGLFPKFSGATFDRLVNMTRINLASQVFFVAGTLLMAAQYARRRFVIPTLAPLIYNLGIIVGGLIGTAFWEPSPEAFLWGGLIGAALGNFGLQVFGARRAGFTLGGRTSLRNSAVGQYFVLAFPLMIGQSAVALDEQWPRLIGQFAGERASTQLYFARLLNMLPVGVIAQAAGVAAFPFLAGLFSQGRLEDMRATVLRSVRSTVAVGGLATALVVATAYPLVRVAYQWGKFDASDTDAVSALLVYYAFSIPFWAAHQVYTRAFYAQRRMWTPVVIGTSVTIVLLPLLFLGVFSLGAPGVALASSFGVALYTVAIAVAWHRSGDRGETRELLRSLGRVALASAAAGAVATGAVALGAEVTDNRIIPSLIAGLTGAAAYLGAGRALHMTELNPIWTRLPWVTSPR